MISTLDALIIGGFLVYCVGSGLSARKTASRGLEQYFLAGRSLPGWKAGMSMAATQFAADTPLLVTGLVATGGVFSLWRLWIYALAFLLMGFVLGPAWRRARVLTDAELAELRYGGRLALVLRVTKAIYFGTVFNCAVVAMVLFAAARIAQPFTSWDRWLPEAAFATIVRIVDDLGFALGGSGSDGAATSANNALSLLAIVSVTMLYSTTGGLRAVVNTDVAQLAIALVATAGYAVVVVTEVGGLSAIGSRLTELYGDRWTLETLAFTPSGARDLGWMALATISVQWLAQMNADGSGYLAQRTMACRSDEDARHAALVFTVTQVVIRSLLWIAIALGLLVLIPADLPVIGSAAVTAREGTFVDGISGYLPSGLRGLMLVGMIAALASTLDTHLNWGASYWTNDIYKRVVSEAWLRREPSGRELVWVARASNIVILAISLLALSRLESIQQAWQTTLLLGAGMGVPLLLRWVFWRMTALAELSAIGVGTLLAPVLLATVDDEGARMLVMTGTTAAVALLVTFTVKVPSPQCIEFYRRVRPPGAWGPVAVLCDDDPAAGPRRLGFALFTTAASAFAVFSLLVGAGTWLFDSPPPLWLPWRVPFLLLLLLLGSCAGLVAMRAQRALREQG